MHLYTFTHFYINISLLSLFTIITTYGMEPACTRDAQGRTPLHHAVHDIALVHKLVELGAPVDAQDNEGITALHLAAAYQQTAVVEYLLSQKASGNAVSKKGWSPLLFAAAFCSHHDTIVKILVDHGAQVNIQEPIAGCTPLHLVYQQKRGGITQLWQATKALLEAGARIDIQNARGFLPESHEDLSILLYVYAPFEEAVQKNDIEKAFRYIKQGINVNRPNNATGITFLKLAQNHKHDAMVCLLLDHGAQPTRTSFEDTSNPTTKLLMTHVPKWLIKEHWNCIGMTLLCTKQCSIPRNIRKIIVYYATKAAILDAMSERAKEFCYLYAQEFESKMPQPGMPYSFGIRHNELYNSHYYAELVIQYIPQWMEQIEKDVR